MSEEKNTEAKAPVKRDRKPVLKTGKTASSATEDTHKRQTRLQQEAVERHEKGLTETQRRNLELSTPTKLSTKEFVGKVPGEPHKDEEEEARKQNGGVGKEAGADRFAIARPTEFPIIKQEAHGDTVDSIVASPSLLENGVPGATQLTEPQKTQATVDAHRSKGGKKAKAKNEKKGTSAEKK